MLITFWPGLSILVLPYADSIYKYISRISRTPQFSLWSIHHSIIVVCCHKVDSSNLSFSTSLVPNHPIILLLLVQIFYYISKFFDNIHIYNLTLPHLFILFLLVSYTLQHPLWMLQITFFATSYVIPLALICGLYLCMLMRLWRGVAPGGHCSAESRRGKKRVTRMVVVVVAIFAICWCPIQVSGCLIFNQVIVPNILEF